MAKPAGELEQWETRRGITMRDQHGREYTAEMDIRTMGTVGPITPRNFRQPIPTPAQYLAPVKDQLGVVRIDYDKWKRDLMMAEGTRVTKLRGLGREDVRERVRDRAQGPARRTAVQARRWPAPG
jgi:hypothetical protein